MKTNAMRALDTLGIHYEIREYEADPNDLPPERIAGDIGLPPEQVFKTLVARGDRHGVLFAVVPANAEVDLKALSRQSQNRTVELVPLKEVQPLTGYIRGGVTALAAKRDYPVYVDEQIELHDVVAVSAGVRGRQMLLRRATTCARRRRSSARSAGSTTPADKVVRVKRAGAVSDPSGLRRNAGGRWCSASPPRNRCGGRHLLQPHTLLLHPVGASRDAIPPQRQAEPAVFDNELREAETGQPRIAGHFLRQNLEGLLVGKRLAEDPPKRDLRARIQMLACQLNHLFAGQFCGVKVQLRPVQARTSIFSQASAPLATFATASTIATWLALEANPHGVLRRKGDRDVIVFATRGRDRLVEQLGDAA